MGGYQGMAIPVWIKFAICIGFDVFDFTIGRVLLGVSILGEVGTTAIMFALWGPIGLFALWEVADVTEQLDGFLPTCTLIGIGTLRKSAGTA